MPEEQANKTIITLLLLTMVVTLSGTFIVLTRLGDMSSQGLGGITGMAKSDIGYAKIFIADVLAIDVPANNDTIDFGNCTPPTTTNTNVTISSEMTEGEVNATGGGIGFGGCTGSNIPAAIVILNTGNVPAIVNVSTDALGPNVMTSTRAEIYYKTTNGAINPGCGGAGDLVANWDLFDATGTDFRACDNLTSGESSNTFYFWINLTLPNDAATTSRSNATLTFQAYNQP